MSELPLSKLQLMQSDDLLREVSIVPGEEILIGQSEKADLRIPHSSVSNAHARVYLSDGEVYLEDLGSEAGTFVDGRRVDGPVKLRHEQRILLGQHSVLRPVVLCFNDPAEQILMAMGLKETNGNEALAKTSVEETPDPSPEARRRSELAQRVAERHQKRSKVLRLAGMVLGTLVAGVVVTLSVWGLLEMLRPSATVWRSVQVNPAALSPGGDMVLQSPDIHPRDRLSVLIASIPAHEKERDRGRIVVTVPELDKRPSGVQEIPLSVRRDGVEVYQRMVNYIIQPKITSVEPGSPEVGEVVRVKGTGFSEDRSSVFVRAGEHLLPIESVTPNEIAVRIPVLTRGEQVGLPLEVQIGDWRASLPELLVIRPRRPEPLSYKIEASYEPDRQAWLLHHPFGPLFYVRVEEKPAEERLDEEVRSLPAANDLADSAQAQPAVTKGAISAPDGLPKRVLEISERMERLFVAARERDDVRVEIESGGGTHALTASGEGLESSFTLVRWPGNELADTSAPGRRELSTQILAYWIGGRLNHFLNAFAKGQMQEVTESSPAYLSVLNQLVEANIGSGGEGPPETRELERMDESARLALEEAFLPIPKGVGTLSGRWLARLENVFVSEDDGFEVEVELDFDQRRGRVSGVAEASLARQNMSFTLQKAMVSGRMEWGTPASVDLSIPFSKPIGSLELEGTLEDAVLRGTFKSRRGNREGRWYAVRSDD